MINDTSTFPIFPVVFSQKKNKPQPSFLGTLRIAATSSAEKKPGYRPMCTCKPVDSLVAARRGARRKALVMSQKRVTSKSSKLILGVVEPMAHGWGKKTCGKKQFLQASET